MPKREMVVSISSVLCVCCMDHDLSLYSPLKQISDGGVHSHITHLYALLETAKEQGVPHVYIHFFGDGRDTAPRSASGYAKDLLAFIEKEKYGQVATVVGRYYAMDRDKRWERVKIAVDGLVKGEGEKGEDIIKTIEERYKKDETDEFLKPIVVNGDEGRIKGTMTVKMSSIWSPDNSLVQMTIRCSSSTTARTACVNSSLSSVCQISLWK